MDKDIDETIEQINLLLNEKMIIKTSNKDLLKEKKIKERIREELNIIGYNFSHIGTKYILEVIYNIYILKDCFINNLEKYIYPLVAKKFGKTSHNIKCNIRNAIELMYFNNKEEDLKNYFGVDNIESYKTKKIIKVILKKIN